MKKVITRRDFMKKSAYAVLGTAAGLSSSVPDVKKSRVVLIRNAKVLDENYSINEEILQEMLDDAMTALFDKKTPQQAFENLFKPEDVVGIKSNVWNYLPTPVELEKAIELRVLGTGVKAKNIGIDDRGVRTNPLFQKATALINVRPMRTHYLAGMSGCMKNLITFLEKWHEIHPNNCANLGRLVNLPMVKGKIRLHILCVLSPQFHGRGPHHFNRRFVWNYQGLLLSPDPVAIDTIGLQILMAKRKQHFGGQHRLSPIPKYIKIADETHRVGTSDLSKIELIKMGWKDQILI